MKRINFFALRADIVQVLTIMQGSFSIKFVRVKDSSEPSIEEFERWGQLPELGKATADQWINCDSYLIAKKSEPLHNREIKLPGSGIRYSVDQLLNQDTIVFSPGGEWKDGSIIGGFFATVSDSKPAQELMRIASGTIKKSFVRVRAFWVGPQALIALRKGIRLATAIQSPAKFDLQE